MTFPFSNPRNAVGRLHIYIYILERNCEITAGKLQTFQFVALKCGKGQGTLRGKKEVSTDNPK